MKKYININDYPQLQLLLWDCNCKTISNLFAFNIYESRCKYLEIDKLIDREKELIINLIKKYGKGTSILNYLLKDS